jgi:hypothetical protein
MIAPEGLAMTLTPHMREILTVVLAESHRLEAVPDRPPPGMDREEWRDLWRECKEHEQFGAPHNLARWLGHAATASESAVFSRALRNMEAMGLVLRVNRWGGSKTTHVRLTAAGRAEAERLVADQDAAMEALLKDLAPFAESLGHALPEGPRNPDNSVDSTGQ